MPLGTYLETGDIRPQVEIIVIIILHQKDFIRSTPLNSKVVSKQGLPKKYLKVYLLLFVYERLDLKNAKQWKPTKEKNDSCKQGNLLHYLAVWLLPCLVVSHKFYNSFFYLVNKYVSSTLEKRKIRYFLFSLVWYKRKEEFSLCRCPHILMDAD